MSKAFYITLKNRGLIHIEGKDRIEFLQGLVSNDILKLEQEKILYACLLTPQGKFLHDFFIHHGDGFIMLDCEGGGRTDDLYERLNKYRLRADIFLSVEKFSPAYALFNTAEGLPDPRHFKMGNRSFEKPALPEQDFKEWDKERIMLGIADGSRDMIPEKSTLLECSIDKFNGIDFEKGCYIGQELTSRMNHRHLGKKHLQTLQFNKNKPPPEPFTEVTLNGTIIGNMRSACDDIGLAVIKDEYLEGLKHDNSSIRLLG